MKSNKKVIRSVARVLICALAYQLVYPLTASALTSGPSQPEVQSFEPVGTTDMVDLFSGDFVYNIPLLDVEGYPINISYHGGSDMESEASWVGLGWNINPGVVNHTVRGLPDDFKGDSIKKELHIEDEENVRIAAGVGIEPVGVSAPLIKLDLGLGAAVNINNYRGVSVDINATAGINVKNTVSAGVNLGVGSQSGADIDLYSGYTMAHDVGKYSTMGVGFNTGHGYNTRTGLKDLSFSVSSFLRLNNSNRQFRGGGGSVTVPIGVKNIVPVITNRSTMMSIYGQIKAGPEGFWIFGNANINAMKSTLHYDENGSRKGYGYLYLDEAKDDNITDFTRDRDGMFNKTMQYLAPGNTTYDIYSVNGQGTGGSFRPFRNDFGSVYDPFTRSESNGRSGVVESGLGWNFEVGFNATITNTDITSGPWEEYQRTFKGTEPGNIYESTYFKQAGEMSSTQPEYMGTINGLNPLVRNGIKALPQKKTYADSKREPRGNMMYFFNADEASRYGIASSQKIYSYTSTNGFAGGAAVSKDSFSRIGTGQYQRKPHQISEVVQVQTNGSRYVYGIAAMNNVEKEVTFSIAPPAADSDRIRGVVTYQEGVDDSKNNGHAPEKYYSASWTPAYAHSFLLTSVLSPDYVDVTGNGTSDDDLGSYTRFNYTCKDKDYRWRAPYTNGRAQHNPGFRSDRRDDKALYTVGSREQWMLHSVESKNFVAEFYTSDRKDGRGVTNKISGASGFEQTLTAAGKSYKLDSIKLYNKHDRFINLANAVPVKTVIFEYDYSLCPYVPNIDPTAPANTGKLTLRKIFMRYGNSDKSMISPYQFNYSGFNPSYNLAAKDRWGAYKPNNDTLPNHEFPFVNQNSDSLDVYATAWSLTEVLLPSGGSIKVNYEADDYAYVQDKVAMEMFKITGVGNSKNRSTGSQLFFDKNSPNLYLYFKRRRSAEKKNLKIRENYFKGQETLYMNFNIALEGNKYEVIRGYGAVEEIDSCTNDTAYAYIKIRDVKPKGGGAKLHPMTYTALNIGRFNLPHIIYPGSNPDVSDMQNVLSGLGHSIKELVNYFKNPLIILVKEGKGKNVDLNQSYVRLNNPGMKKKGGGQRVKSLLFYDNWTQMAGGASQTAQYGKQYDYTKTDESGVGTISSGVASYEPQIGGDENPFRMPVKYEAQSGSSWPPNDPIELYQELPIGESLYPTPTVGYSMVTVKSIHQDKGRSSQGIDIHEFYTARDYPVELRSTGIDRIANHMKSNFVIQENVFKGSQGYTLIMNDMHGKPRRTEHRIIKPQGGTELVSYTQHHYRTKDGKLNNDVQVLVYDEATKQMKKETRPVGMEVDVTIDSRRKYEKTVHDQFYMNTNTSSIGWFTIPVPLPFYWYGQYSHEFCSAVATKVVQQYGILEEVESYQEGALTRARNEVFDPITGQPLLTSINNEFRDREYTLNYPAYWGYKGMGPAYENIGYTDQYPAITASNRVIYIPAGTRNKYYRLGDELLVTYKLQGDINPRTANLWIVGFDRGSGVGSCCSPIAAPRNLYDPSWVNTSSNITLTEVNIKVVRSGNKNQLGEMMQTVQAYANPLSGTYLSGSLSGVVNITAREYGNELNGVVPRHFDNDSLNPYISGRNSIHKLFKEHAYLKNRDYTAGTVRNTGLFNANSYFVMHTGILDFCNGSACQDETNGAFYASYMKPQPIGSDPNWVTARTVTEWAPFGQEVENKDALNNYSAASYGYNNELPVAVASNARQQEVLAEGFEDYRLLQVMNAWMSFNFSPFRQYFSLQAGQAGYGTTNLSGSNGLTIVNTAAHTGFYALRTSAGGFSLPMTVQAPSMLGSTPNGRFYFFNLGQRKLMPFTLQPDMSYIVSYWVRPVTTTGLETSYSGIPLDAVTGYPYRKKANIIEGWQQVEARFNTTAAGQIQLALPANYYVDDIRIFPVKSNMKAFVYHPFNEKLMATLDENNFATFYEYDQEGNLIRTKRETEKGIMTISESRNANPKK